MRHFSKKPSRRQREERTSMQLLESDANAFSRQNSSESLRELDTGEVSSVTKLSSSLMINGENSPLARNFKSPLEREEDTRFHVHSINPNVQIIQDKLMLTGIVEAIQAEEDFNEETYSLSNDSDIVI